MASNSELTSARITVDTDDEAQDRFYREGWTDGLPIVLPTDERVGNMVEASGMKAGEVIATIPPGTGAATVEKIAINAVMAGCLTEYIPAIIAAIKALTETKFNLNGIQTTTNPAGTLILFNGPIRNELAINCGSNCLGPGSRANSAIGRAIRLCMLNIGGAIPGEIDKATQGMPGKYALCFGELEEESPWPPFHVERGFNPEDNVVTVMGSAGTHNATGGGPVSEELLKTLGRTMVGVGLNNFRQGQGEPMLVMNPTFAKQLGDDGYSKKDVKEKLLEYSALPLSFVPEGVAQQRFSNRPVTDPVPLIPEAKDLILIVAGGPGSLHSTFLPTFGDTWSVSHKIDS
ncbi:hypothetical protein M1O29_03965 [Dehalococcoidia bacterium]|nr:hypothetical protein [Dehalococcoidia bacterium]